MSKPLLTILIVLFVLGIETVSAAETKDEQFLLSEDTYKALNQAQELMEKESYPQA